MSISNRAAKGIKQADMLLVDLSLKSLGNLLSRHPLGGVKELPEPRGNRVVFFGRSYADSSSVFNCLGCYLDFDPSLWDIMKYLNEKTSMGIFPRPRQDK